MPFSTPIEWRVGGVLKASPDDFVVDEIPSEQPVGRGDHLWLWVEKRGIDARSLARRLSAALHISERDIGTAGNKDTQAVTRQFVSVPVEAEPHLSGLQDEDLRVLSATLHTSKLRTGNLWGNRFVLRLRDVGPNAVEMANKIADAVKTHGVPNYYGLQRFGREGSTVASGLAFLAGEKVSDPFMRKLGVSSVQSLLFNMFLAERVKQGTWRSPVTGDVVWDPTTDTHYWAVVGGSDNVVPTGPMFGGKMRRGRVAVLAQEEAALARMGLRFADFGDQPLAPGTRRSLVLRPKDLVLEHEGNDLILRFDLPKGSYATVLVREWVKTPEASF